MSLITDFETYITPAKTDKFTIYNEFVTAFLRKTIQSSSQKVYDIKSKNLLGWFASEIKNYNLHSRLYEKYNKTHSVTRNFNNLVKVFKLNIGDNTNYAYNLNTIPKKIAHILSYFYDNNLFYNVLSGSYPYKFVVKYDNIMSKVFFINNKYELKKCFIELFFNVFRVTNNISNQDAIEYYNSDGGNAVMDDYEDQPVIEEAQNSFNLIKVKEVEFTFIKFGNRGRFLPDELKLPNDLGKSLICPNNTDHYCLIWNILINKHYVSNPKEYSKIKNKLALNKIENYPKLKEEFDLHKPKFEKLYFNKVFMFSDKNMRELENIFQVNVNLYCYLNGDEFSPYYRSEMRHDDKFVARLVYIPYNVMELKRKSYSKYQTNKKLAEICTEFDDAHDDFFELNNGHFCTALSTCKQIFGEFQKNKYFTCNYCDVKFSSLKLLQDHFELCKLVYSTDSEQRLIKYKNNKADDERKFTNYHALSKSPFLMFADTETKTDADGHKLFSYSIFLQSSFDSKLDRFILRTAEDDSQIGDYLCKKFIEDITELRYYISKNVNKYQKLDPLEREAFVKKNPKTCCQFCDVTVEELKERKEEYLAEGKILKDDEANKFDLVVHHNHNIPSPNIVGYLCQSCNIKESKVNKIFSIFFHNLSYDLLVLIKAFAYKELAFNYEGKVTKIELINNLEIMAKTNMKYSGLIIKAEKATLANDEKIWLPAIKFTDSFAFINSSLGKIVSNIKRNQKDLKPIFVKTYEFITKKYDSIASRLFDYATKKGVIAYSHTTIENMKSKTNLPKNFYRNDLALTQEFIESFKETDRKKYNKLLVDLLKEEIALNKCYKRANEIFDLLAEFYGDEMCYQKYFEFYLELDIFLLTDCFQFIRNKMFESHKLDMAAFSGLPGYSQSCMLYMTRNKMKLIPHVSDSRLFVRNLRGGFSGIRNKRAIKKMDSIIKYWDANNLYGFAMRQKLANKYLGEISKPQFKKEMKTYDPNGEFCYFLWVDYKIPEEIHDKLEIFPPLINKKEVNFSDLSDAQKEMKVIKESYKSEKLCATLEDGKDYLVALDNLLFYERLGYKFEVKLIYKFEQEYLFQSYIDMNSKLRQNCKNELEKDFYKLLNNIIYGKSLENPEKYSEIELLSNESVIAKRVQSPLLKRCEIIVDDELVITDLYKSQICYNTCIQAGFSILEKTKLHMYSLLYDCIIPFCKDNKIDVQLLMHDTDSFLMEFTFSDSKIKTEEEMMIAMKNDARCSKIFDLHLYNNPAIKDTSQKKVVGLLLDEYSDIFEIIGYVGLCSKSYCYLLQKKLDVKLGNKDLDKLAVGDTYLAIKGKGVSNRYLKTLYDYDDYEKVLKSTKENPSETIKFKNIQRQNFANVVKEITKKSISNFDDKFYSFISNDELVSLPYGHYKIKKQLSENQNESEQK